MASIIKAIGGVITVIFLVLLPIIPVQVSTEVPYQDEVQSEVPLLYDLVSHSYTFVGILDWELKYECTLENVDTESGTFTVSVQFKEGNVVVDTASDRKYIGSGESETFEIQSSGLSFSTDWASRYSVVPSFTPSTKIVSNLVTKYRTEHSTKSVNLLQYIFGNQ